MDDTCPCGGKYNLKFEVVDEFNICVRTCPLCGSVESVPAVCA